MIRIGCESSCTVLGFGFDSSTPVSGGFRSMRRDPLLKINSNNRFHTNRCTFSVTRVRTVREVRYIPKHAAGFVRAESWDDAVRPRPRQRRGHGGLQLRDH